MYRFLIVLNEEVVGELYETEAEAREAARRLVREHEAEHGRGPSWFIVAEERVN